MLRFCHGTDLDTMADHLIKALHTEPRNNPLSQEIIVVQNHGIGQWLSLRMAEKKGISANLKFEFPSERIWYLIRLLDDQIPQSLPSDRRPMAWALMDLLREEAESLQFSQLSAYWQDEDPIQQEVRRWKLSEKIADVFDQYLIYRPHLLVQWEQGIRQYPNSEAEEWQALLWRKLLKRWEGDHYKYLHRADLQMRMMKALDEGMISEENLPERVTVFGVSEMSPAFIQTMIKLSRLIDVHFYYRSVDTELTDNTEFSNPLLQSLGGTATDFNAYFSQFLNENPAVANLMEEVVIESRQRTNSSIFCRVQQDLREDNLPDNSVKRNRPDTSIQVHSCHSPMREVEVLYDQLLSLFDRDPKLNPDEVLIMTPDIETYAPLIDAVFSNVESGVPEIPYSIADRGVQGADPAIQSFLKVLKLAESRFTVTDVVDLLDSGPIRETFSFSEDDIQKVEKWIRDNRIRWGINGDFRQQLGVPNEDSFTWKAGLDRILLGYAMKQDSEKLYKDVFPYSEIETSDEADLAGKLSHFLNILFSVAVSISSPRTPYEWIKKLLNTVDLILPESQKYYRQVTRIRKSLEEMRKNAELGNYKQAVPFGIILSRLEDQLSTQTTGGGRIGRGVTFSSLMPMRSIPFSVIGMIGMNEGAFPRTSIPIEFDLMHLSPKPGDPKRSELDRYLFLENLFSAKTHVYFSYVGQSNRQDGDFPSSVIVREFLDYLARFYGISLETLLTKHPLQAFSPKYFKGDKKLFSYSLQQKEISSQLEKGTQPHIFMDSDLPEPDEKYKLLTVNELISFFQHPAKFTLQNRLGIYLTEENVLTEDREPFVLKGLEGYNVGHELFKRYLKQESMEAYQPIARARDLLPAGWSGERAYRNTMREVEIVGKSIRSALEQSQLEVREVDLNFGDFRLLGTLDDIFEEELIRYRFGKCRPKDLIGWWISHLIFQLVKPADHSGYSKYISKDSDKKRAEEQTLAPVVDAKEQLQTLLDLYWQGLQREICFYPETSLAFAENLLEKNKSIKQAINSASKSWIKDSKYHYGLGDGEDPYNRLMISNGDTLKSDVFQQNAVTVWQPFLKAKKQ